MWCSVTRSLRKGLRDRVTIQRKVKHHEKKPNPDVRCSPYRSPNCRGAIRRRPIVVCSQKSRGVESTPERSPKVRGALRRRSIGGTPEKQRCSSTWSADRRSPKKPGSAWTTTFKSARKKRRVRGTRAQGRSQKTVTGPASTISAEKTASLCTSCAGEPLPEKPGSGSQSTFRRKKKP